MLTKILRYSLLMVTCLLAQVPWLHAKWQIVELRPESAIDDDLSQFIDYLTDEGSTLLKPMALADFKIGDADAVYMFPPTFNSSGYTAAEISVLKTLLTSGVRVLVVGDNSNFVLSNKQITSLLGGTYVDYGAQSIWQTPVADSGSAIGNRIIEGVNEILWYASSGILVPEGSGGHLLADNSTNWRGDLLSGGSISLWGEDDNFLFVQDMNLFTSHINENDNTQLAKNIAWFLSGGQVVPEPETWAAFAGLFFLGYVILRRRRVS